MDKELIAGLSNLSESLDRIAEVLSKKEEPKSATAMALKMGEFDKQIIEISKTVISIKEDTKKLLDQQDTILKILKKTDKDVKDKKVKQLPQEQTAVKVSKDRTDSRERDDKIKKVPTQPTTQKVAKDKSDDKAEKKKSFFGDFDTTKIKDGLSTILLIATGIVAIGLALKLVGKVDFLSVIALSIALPLIAIAFEKIARVNLDRKRVPDMILALVGFSTAIALSSFILSKVRPIGLFQAFSSIMIAGVFAMIAPNLGKLVNGLKDVNFLTMLKAVVFLPVILASVSLAIMLSSKFLANVKPIGLFQAFTAIMIAGVFATVAFGLGKLLGGFKGLNPLTAVIASALLPIVLVAVSYAIMKSSFFLANVKPIGLFQAFSAIMIAAVFAVVSFGIGKMISAFRGVNPIVAGVAALLMPILLIALSYSIMKSSYFLANVKPIGLFQAFTSILIAVTFVILSYAVAKILPAFRRVSLMDAGKAALMMPLIFTAMSVAIMLSSYPLSKVKPIGLFQFLTSIAISILFVAQSFLFVKLVKILKNTTIKDIVQTGVKLVAISTSIFAAGFIISKMPQISIIQTLKVMLFTALLIPIVSIFKSIVKLTSRFSVSEIIKEGLKVILIIGILAASAFLVGKMKIDIGNSFKLVVFTIALAITITIMSAVFKTVGRIGLGTIIKGSISIIAIAATIMISSLLLSLGKYTKYPSFKWSLSVILTLGAFGIGAVLLGTQAMNPMFYMGLGIILVLAGVIVATSYILGAGKYNKYPSLAWALGVGASLAGFGIGAILLGTQVFNPFFYAGLGMIAAVAAVVVGTSYILDAGKYDKYPPMAWVLPTVLVIGTFGLVAVGLGIVSPLLLLGLPALLAIAGTILLIDKVFNIGKYDRYPTKDWVNPSILVIGKFAATAILYAFALPLIILGGVSILAVAGIIWMLDKVFSKGEYKKWPSDKWINGVTHVISRVSKLLQTVRKELGFGDLVLGAIKLLGTIYTIKLMDDVLKKGDYVKYPSTKWNDGVSYSIRTFMQLMKDKSFMTVMKERLGSLLGGGLDDIAGIIVKIDKKLSKGEYKKIPSMAWNKGMASALSNVISLMKNNSILSSIGNKIGDLFGAGLTGTAQTIVDIDKILSKGNYTKFPSSAWSSNVLSVLSAFKAAGGGGGTLSNIASAAGGVVASGLNFISGLFGSKSSTTGSSKSRSLTEIAEEVKNVSLKISSGNYTKFPAKEWLSSIISTLTSFSGIIKGLGVSSTIGIMQMDKLSRTIISIDKIFDTGKFKNYPKDPWVKSLTSVFTTFVGLLKSLSGSIISVMIGSKLIDKITQSILKIDTDFSKGKFIKYPNDKWVNSIINVYTKFSQILNSVGKNILSNTLGLLSINKITESILRIDTDLTRGKFVKYPNEKWINSISMVYMKFSQLLSKIGSNILSNTLGLMTISKITKSIIQIDIDFGKGRFTNYPSDKWINSISNLFNRFTQILSSIGKNILSNTLGAVSINKVTSSILKIDKDLSSGKFNRYPSDKWITSIFNVYNKFTSLLSSIGKNILSNTLGILSLNQVTKSILSIDKDFSKGKFTTYPSDKWITSIFNVYNKFTSLLSSIGKNFIGNTLGIVSLSQVTRSILSIDKDFSKGKFTTYPSDKWISSIISTFNKFTQLLSTVGKNVIGNTIGSLSLRQLTSSILRLDKEISTGKFTNYPSDKWMSSITSTYTKFSKMISSMGKSIASNLLGTASLSVLTKSILNVDREFSRGKFVNYPLSKWTDSVIKSIDQFTKLIFNLSKNIVSNLIGIFSLTKIVKTILNVDTMFSTGKYNKYPDNKWISSSIKSISDFASLINRINSNLNLPNLIIGQFKIKNIVDFILYTDKKLASGKYNKWPDQNWIKKTTSSILFYGQTIVKSDKDFPISKLIGGLIKDKIIVEMILWVDKKLSTGKYNKWPDNPWISKSISAILSYGRLAMQSDKEFKMLSLITGISKIRLITSTVLWVDKTLDSGKYKKWPEQLWISRTSNSILKYGQLAIDVDKRFGIAKLWLGLKKVKDIADTIRHVSLTIDKGKYTKFPSLEWSKSVTLSISEFMKMPFKGTVGLLMDKIFGASEDQKKSQLGKIVDLMIYVDKKFQAGNWSKFPTVQWVNGTILALQKFRSIVGLLSFGSMKDKVFSYFGVKSPIVTAVSNIEKLAYSFSKLSAAMKSFSSSIKELDSEKLSAIKSLSTNVVLLSLMNPDQFDEMMNKLEERAGVFNELIKDFESKKEEAQKDKGSAVGPMKAKPSVGTPKVSDAQILSQKMDVMNSLLSDIASVVGSRGALKNYLNKIKDDVSIGGSSQTITNKSDRRLKKIVKKLTVSDSGINVYLFSYNFDPNTLYQGVIAQELLNTPYENALHIDKNGIYSVDYSKIDVEFKKHSSNNII
jgi:hypothetical protein